ncbi:MAG: LysR family transcriptional regulator [Paracoccaceae bacterium]|jgi:DNA-binding transcriptional LysR family regulator|nr:LysR family transcriptional regulator [Paracoccaceae bacterium]
MHRFSLRQLEYLVACIDHGSTARAANALNVSQPTVSIAVTKLEDQLGVQLLRRHHSQGVTATPSAENILPSARALLAHATDLQKHITTTGDTISGELRLGSFTTLASSVLPRLVNAVSGQYPDIHLQISEGTQDELVEGLNSGQLELALLYDLNLPDDIQKTEMLELTPHVVLPKNHRLSSQTEIDLADLVNEPFILLDVPPSRDFFIGLFRATGLTPNIVHSSPSLELVRGLVGYGLGFSLLVTRPSGDTSYDGQPLSIRPLKNSAAKSSIVLARHKDLRSTKLMTLFTNLAKTAIHRSASPDP